jgi:hypothetical protein
MKLSAFPLLDSGSPGSFTVNDLQPRQFVDLLDQHKALILSNADPSVPLTAEDFGDFLVSLHLEYYPYIGGAAPRTVIPLKAGPDIVFTANERYESKCKQFLPDFFA